MSAEKGSSKHLVLWALVAALAVAVSVCAYVVFGPGPTDFAGGKRVAPAAYR